MSRMNRDMDMSGLIGTGLDDWASKRGKLTYLKLPENTPVYRIEDPGEYAFDFLTYEVTDDRHMERNEAKGVAVPGSYWWRKPFRLHRDIGVERVPLVCPTTRGMECPICVIATKRGRHVSKEEWRTEVAPLRYSERSLYCIIPRGDRKHPPVPHLWDISDYAFFKLMYKEIQRKAEHHCFANVRNGKLVVVRFEPEGTGQYKYLRAARVDFEDRPGQISDRDLEQVLPLDDFLIYPSKDEIQDILNASPDLYGDDGASGGTAGERQYSMAKNGWDDIASSYGSGQQKPVEQQSRRVDESPPGQYGPGSGPVQVNPQIDYRDPAQAGEDSPARTDGYAQTAPESPPVQQSPPAQQQYDRRREEGYTREDEQADKYTPPPANRRY